MAVSNTDSKIQYVGNNSTVTPYTITFPFTEQAWIKCQLLDEDGNVTNLVLDTDYTVTGEGDPSGGELTTAVAYDNTYQLTIYRVAPLTQLLDLVYNDRLPAQLLEDALDKITYIAQQLSTLGDPGQATLKFPISEPVSFDTELPVPALRLGKYIYFNELTGELELVSGVGTFITDDVTIETNVGDSTIQVKDGGISLAKLASVATGIVLGRRTAGTGAVEAITIANLLTDLVAAGGALQPLVVSENVTATLGRTHHLVASATFTDPTPVEGGSFTVKVLNGTATVGGTAYSTYGTIIERSYHSGAWQTNRVYINGPQFLAAQSPTGVETSLDFTGIPTNVKRITVSFAVVSTNGTSNIIIQIGDSGGIETSGYAGGLALDGVSAAISTGFGAVRAPATSSNYNGSIILTRYNGTSFYWVSSGAMAGNTGEITTAAGSKLLSDSLDRLRITTAGGVNTFDGGGISVMFEF